jgi:hypothetical protein
MNQEDFLIDAKKENYLTQEILDDIIPKLQEDQAEYVASILNTDFYEHEIQENGDIVIKLSDKWKEVEHKTEEDESIQLQTSSMD